MTATIRYMGSKRSLAPGIAATISASHKRAIVVDVFAGTCAVASTLAPRHRVVTNDIHAYAEIVARALLVSPGHAPTSLVAKDELRRHYYTNQEKLTKPLRRRLRKEAEAIALTTSTADGWRKLQRFTDEELEQNAPRHLHGLPSWQIYADNHKHRPYSLFSRYFASAYFGISQSIEIDSLRYAIDRAPSRHRDFYLNALIQATSHCAATPGHFAQYLVPRDKRNTAYVARIRSRSVLERFMRCLDAFDRPTCLARDENAVFRSDATNFLRNRKDAFQNGKVVIYADPPYSRAQYSRYYHVLETLVLYDYPDCSGKGRYRGDRIQTSFSQRAQVITAMDQFVESAAATGAPLYLSYPSRGLFQDAGGNLKQLLKRHYPHVAVVAREPLAHSTLGGAPGTASVNVTEDVHYASWD